MIRVSHSWGLPRVVALGLRRKHSDGHRSVASDVMASRFTYSRWDGTQQGFELDGDALFEELTDELLYHGDVNAALRRMMHQGLRDRNGDRLSGVRELLDKLRRERQERLDRFDLGGVYDEIARELDDIVDEERHAIDNASREAETLAARTGDERRAETARETAAERNMRLDFLPDDLAGKVRELQAVRLRVGRGGPSLRGAARPAAPAAGQPAVRADERGDAADDAAGPRPHEGHDGGAQRDARAARAG